MADPPSSELRRGILLRAAADVDVPLEVMAERCGGGAALLGPLASAATRDGAEVLVDVGPEWAAGLLSREVRVGVGSSYRRGQSLVMPISWHAEQMARAFPVFIGEIEVTPLESGACRLVVSGSYAAPLGAFGRQLDRLVLHRVAESTLRSFLRQLVAALAPGDEPAVATPELGDIRPGFA